MLYWRLILALPLIGLTRISQPVVLAIPPKRFDKRIVTFLNAVESDARERHRTKPVGKAVATGS